MSELLRKQMYVYMIVFKFYILGVHANCCACEKGTYAMKIKRNKQTKKDKMMSTSNKLITGKSAWKAVIERRKGGLLRRRRY